MFQGCFKEVLRVIQGRLRGVPKDQGSFKGISRKIKGCFNEVLSVFQGCLREFPNCFKDVSRKF